MKTKRIQTSTYLDLVYFSAFFFPSYYYQLMLKRSGASSFTIDESIETVSQKLSSQSTVEAAF